MLHVMAGVLIVFSLLVEIFMPEVMSVIAGGFRDDPEKFQLAVDFARLADERAAQRVTGRVLAPSAQDVTRHDRKRGRRSGSGEESAPRNVGALPYFVFAHPDLLGASFFP